MPQKKYLIFILLLLPLYGLNQNNGCIDSVSLNQFYPSTFNTPISIGAGFYFTPQRDALDNLYTSGSSGSGAFNDSYWSIIKFDVNNNLVWYKNYKTDLFLTFKGGGNLYDIEPNGNLIFASILDNPASSSSKWLIFSKTDNTANFLWSRTIKHATQPNIGGGLGFPNTNNNGELFLLGRYFDNREEPLVVAFDASGNLKWSKRYKNITVPKFHLLGSSITVENNTSITVAIQYYYDADIITDPVAKHGFQLFKLNTVDGSINTQTSFMYYNDMAGNNVHRTLLQKINYDAITKRFLLCSAEGPGAQNCVLSLFDENLNHLKTTFISSPITIGGITKKSISKRNEVCLLTDNQGPVQSFRYTTIDNELNLVSQKYINLAALGFPPRNFEVDLSYKKNGMLSFQVGTYGPTPIQYFYIQDQSPFYNNVNTCVGKDSLRYSVFPIYTKTVTNPFIEEAGITPLTITNNFPDSPPVEFALPKSLICKEVSICDTIKLFGIRYHCLSNPLDSFKIFRNPYCKRVSKWQVDTNYIKILSSNDTTLYVEYLQPYRGNIKVSFGGCSLSDSIPIEVYAAQTGVNLGNDTMHCPGKTIILRAGKNFRTYLWNDGSNKDSLIAAQPGNYRVTVTDSCGNVFKDTLVINPFDVMLKTDLPQWLCPGDTATFILPTQLINYSWLPSTNSSLTGLIWRLFPSATTTYSISGQRLPGCMVSDTVLIKVKPNCLPDYMYFPNAFTPNENNLNDIYKPGINGTLVYYELILYNRYGQLVFRTTNPTEGWDGRYKNASKPLAGTYIWACKYQFAGRPIQLEQGSFILIR